MQRKTPLSRKPKSERAKLKAQTWKIVSAYVRIRDAVETTGTLESCECVTCGAEKPLFVRGGIEAGHFLPGRHASVVWDTRQIHGQCHYCNNYLNGNTLPYRDYMLEAYGEEYVEKLRQRDREGKQWKEWEMVAMQDNTLKKIDCILADFKPPFPAPLVRVLYPFRDRLETKLK